MPESMVFAAIALYLAIGALATAILKSVADSLPRARALALQFFFAMLLAWAFASATGELHMEAPLLLVTGLGFVVAFGAYAQWQAVSKSLSKTSLFTPLSGVLTAGLAMGFLGETELISSNGWLGVGIALLFVAAILVNKQAKEEEVKGVLGWAVAVIAMILIFGTVQFGMKWFALEGISRGSFLSYWYPGALLGALAVVLIRGKEEQALLQPNHIWKVPVLSALIVASLGASYWAYQLAPATLVAPVALFGLAVLPILIGLWGFEERKALSTANKIGFLLGITGVAAIVVSRYLV